MQCGQKTAKDVSTTGWPFAAWPAGPACARLPLRHFELRGDGRSMGRPAAAARVRNERLLDCLHHLGCRTGLTALPSRAESPQPLLCLCTAPRCRRQRKGYRLSIRQPALKGGNHFSRGWISRCIRGLSARLEEAAVLTALALRAGETGRASGCHGGPKYATPATLAWGSR